MKRLKLLSMSLLAFAGITFSVVAQNSVYSAKAEDAITYLSKDFSEDHSTTGWTFNGTTVADVESKWYGIKLSDSTATANGGYAVYMISAQGDANAIDSLQFTVSDSRFAYYSGSYGNKIEIFVSGDGETYESAYSKIGGSNITTFTADLTDAVKDKDYHDVFVKIWMGSTTKGCGFDNRWICLQKITMTGTEVPSKKPIDFNVSYFDIDFANGGSADVFTLSGLSVAVCDSSWTGLRPDNAAQGGTATYLVRPQHEGATIKALSFSFSESRLAYYSGSYGNKVEVLASIDGSTFDVVKTINGPSVVVSAGTVDFADYLADKTVESLYVRIYIGSAYSGYGYSRGWICLQHIVLTGVEKIDNGPKSYDVSYFDKDFANGATYDDFAFTGLTVAVVESKWTGIKLTAGSGANGGYAIYHVTPIHAGAKIDSLKLDFSDCRFAYYTGEFGAKMEIFVSPDGSEYTSAWSKVAPSSSVATFSADLTDALTGKGYTQVYLKIWIGSTTPGCGFDDRWIVLQHVVLTGVEKTGSEEDITTKEISIADDFKVTSIGSSHVASFDNFVDYAQSSHPGLVGSAWGASIPVNDKTTGYFIYKIDAGEGFCLDGLKLDMNAKLAHLSNENLAGSTMVVYGSFDNTNWNELERKAVDGDNTFKDYTFNFVNAKHVQTYFIKVECNINPDYIISFPDGKISLSYCPFKISTVTISGQAVKHTHEFQHNNVAAAACEIDGTKENWYCEGCETYFVKSGDLYVPTTLDDLRIPALGHEFEQEDYEGPWDHDETGHWHTCGCGETSEVLPHDYDADGYEGVFHMDDTHHWYVCSVCGQESEHMAHVYEGDYYSDENGHWQYCICGKEGPHQDHNWDSGVVTVVPTANEPGEITYTCLDCGYTRTEEIACGQDSINNVDSYMSMYYTYQASKKYTSYVFDKVDFRLKVAIDDSIKSYIYEGDEFGIKVSCNDQTLYCNELIEDEGVLYAVIDLGDCLSTSINRERLFAEFTIAAYITRGDETFVSNKSKTYSLLSMIDEYHNNEETKDMIADLYDLMCYYNLLG